jgi:ribosomal protein S25
MPQQLTRKIQKSKTVRLKPCPKLLGLIIKVANRIPLDADLPLVRVDNVTTAYADIEKRIGDLSAELNSVVKRLPVIGRDSVWSDDDSLYEAYHSYMLVRDFHAKLRQIAEAVTAKRRDAPTSVVRLYSRSAIKFFPNEETFTIVSDPFTQALEELDPPSDITRIRECEVCKLIFWAGRIDQVCCSPYCNHLRHSRRTHRKVAAKISKHERLEKIRKALARGRPVTTEQLCQLTKLTPDVVSDLVAELLDKGEIKSRKKNETREFYSTHRTRKGK